MNKSTAAALHDSKFYERLTDLQIADFQLNEERLCMPFTVFHEALERALGRPVDIHEFAYSVDHLKKKLASVINQEGP